MLGFLIGRVNNALFTMEKANELIHLSKDNYNHIVESQLNNNSNKMNNAMKGLATITALFLPFTVISGLFGMNVKVPMRDIDNLAPFLCLNVGMIFLSISIYMCARYIGWL